MSIIMDFMREDTDLILTDADAVWLRDPFPLLSDHISSEIIASRGWFPNYLFRKWGATLCMGFIYFKSGQFNLRFLNEISNYLDAELDQSRLPDDQLAVNAILDHWNITWLTTSHSSKLFVGNNNRSNSGFVSFPTNISSQNTTTNPLPPNFQSPVAPPPIPPPKTSLISSLFPNKLNLSSPTPVSALMSSSSSSSSSTTTTTTTTTTGPSPINSVPILNESNFHVTLLPHSKFIRKRHSEKAHKLVSSIHWAVVVHCKMPTGVASRKRLRLDAFSLWQLREDWIELLSALSVLHFIYALPSPPTIVDRDKDKDRDGNIPFLFPPTNDFLINSFHLIPRADSIALDKSFFNHSLPSLFPLDSSPLRFLSRSIGNKASHPWHSLFEYGNQSYAPHHLHRPQQGFMSLFPSSTYVQLNLSYFRSHFGLRMNQSSMAVRIFELVKQLNQPSQIQSWFDPPMSLPLPLPFLSDSVSSPKIVTLLRPPKGNAASRPRTSIRDKLNHLKVIIDQLNAELKRRKEEAKNQTILTTTQISSLDTTAHHKEEDGGGGKRSGSPPNRQSPMKKKISKISKKKTNQQNIFEMIKQIKRKQDKPTTDLSRTVENHPSTHPKPGEEEEEDLEVDEGEEDDDEDNDVDSQEQ